jgi:hypothetical protein
VKMYRIVRHLGMIFALAAIASLAYSDPPAGKGHNGSKGGSHEDRGPRQVVVNGTVKSVSPFVVQRSNGREVTIYLVTRGAHQTQFKRSDGRSASVRDLARDLRVQVKGLLKPDGSMLATQVLIKLSGR